MSLLDDLRRAGVPARTARRWAGEGLLNRVHPGVYALGHRRLSTEGIRLAATLACGAGCGITSLTAATMYRAYFGRSPIRVVVAHQRRLAPRRGDRLVAFGAELRAFYGRHRAVAPSQALQCLLG